MKLMGTNAVTLSTTKVNLTQKPSFFKAVHIYHVQLKIMYFNMQQTTETWDIFDNRGQNFSKWKLSDYRINVQRVSKIWKAIDKHNDFD